MTEATAAAPVRKVKLSSLRSDSQREREGDWVPALDIGPEVQYFLRSTNLPAFKIARDHHGQKLARTYGDNIPDDILAEVYGKLAVEHLLMDWKGFVDDEENDIPFSKETAQKILTDPEYRLVRASVYFAATKVGRDEVEFVGTAIKN